MTTLGKWRRFGEQEDNEEHVMVSVLSCSVLFTDIMYRKLLKKKILEDGQKLILIVNKVKDQWK